MQAVHWSAEQHLHEAEAAYAPCFSLQIWDTGGQSAVQTQCFAAVDVRTMLAEVTDATGSSAGATPERSTTTDAATTSHTRGVSPQPSPSTCAVTGASGDDRAQWGLLAYYSWPVCAAGIHIAKHEAGHGRRGSMVVGFGWALTE